MDVANLIGTHGYWLLTLGCLLEGETLLLLAGYAAHRGHLDFAAVVAVAAAAGFVGDQFWFWLGRRHGPAVIARWPSIGRQARRLDALIERFHEAVIIGVRFAYGLRIAGPVLIGTSAIPARRFALFNAIGAVLWALTIAGAGWVFGHAAELLLAWLQRFEVALLLAALVAAVIWWLRRKRLEP
jgi:membrane protein DedA with SNARE-associated domain